MARPRTTAFESDAYPDIWTKAGALLDSIVNDHALVDANERLGWLATAVFLEINGHSVAQVANEDVYELVIDVASRRADLDDLASALRGLVAPAH